MKTMPDRLTRRVTLQSQASGEDALGQPNGAWTAYREVYAEVDEAKGKEGYRGDQIEHTGQIVVIIRHPRGGTFPSVEHRVTWTEGDTGSTRTANITHVERIGHRRRWLYLYCSEVG